MSNDMNNDESMHSDREKLSRRSILTRGMLAGVGGVIAFPAVTSAQNPPVEPPVYFPLGPRLRGASKFTRMYSAIDVSGAHTHAMKLAVSIPIPDDGTLDASCWVSTVRINNMLANPSTGFSGGILSQQVSGPDSVSVFLTALDQARAMLDASVESQLGSVVWSQSPPALNYGLPIGVTSTSCTPLAQAPVPSSTQNPVPSSNPRITAACANLDKIALIRDLGRMNPSGSTTQVRLLFGEPIACSGPSADQISYSCSLQIQGLQSNASWPDGIVTATGGGLDQIGATVSAMQIALTYILASAEGNQSGSLTWLPDPSAVNWGLPSFNPNGLMSTGDMTMVLDGLSSTDRAVRQQALDFDWDAFYS